MPNRLKILVSLTMTLFSEKVLISNRCISGLMPNLIKKSWTDSTQESTCAQCCAFLEVRYFDARPVWAASRAFFENWLRKDKNQTTTEKADKKTRQNVECYWQFASLFEFLKINLVKTQVDEQQAGLFLKIDFEIPR